MSRGLIVAVLMIVLTVAGFSLAVAQQEKAVEKACRWGCIPGKVEVGVVTGVNYCVACGLKGEFGAAAQCATCGHRNGLKVAKMTDMCGEENVGLAGRTLHYLENDHSRELITGYQNETVKVTGKVYLMENSVEVGAFEVVKPE